MNSPTHDAIGLSTAYVLFAPSTANATGLLVGSLCIATHGLLEQRASVRHRAATKRHEELAAVGLAPDFQPRWRGPRRKLTRPLRIAAIIGAGTVALPIGVALATSRLPDQLELGPIDHRKLTHYLLTAAAIILGVYLLGQQATPHTAHELGLSVAQFDAKALDVTRGFGTGYLGHLAADLCTISGLALLWPLIRRELHLLPKSMRVRTGSIVDSAIMLTALGLTVWLTTVHHVGLLEG